MNFVQKIFKFSIILLFISLSCWGYGRFERQNEIADFFTDSAELAWAKEYLDKEINFCDTMWPNTVVVDPHSDQPVYFSPSRRFRIEPYSISNTENAFRIIDQKVGGIIMEFSLGSDPNPKEISHDDVKWAMDEKFVVFRTPIYMDDDWLISRVYIGNTTTGRILYFGDSAFYECALRNW